MPPKRRKAAASAASAAAPSFRYIQPKPNKRTWEVEINGQRFPLTKEDQSGYHVISADFRRILRENNVSELPPGVFHHSASGRFFFARERPRDQRPASYDPTNPRAWFEEAPERLEMEGLQPGAGGYLYPRPVARIAQRLNANVTRYVPERRQTSRRGAVGEYTKITVNSNFSDTERERENDAVEAMAGAAEFVRAQQRGSPGWKVVGLTFVFLLSGEQSNGTMAEERMDNGLYRVPTTLRVGPRQDVLSQLQAAARGVMDKINNGFGGGVEQRFYGVSQWRLAYVEASVSGMSVGRGWRSWDELIATGLPLFEMCARQRKKPLFNPEVEHGCFEHCLSAALSTGPSSLHTPPGHAMADGVPCMAEAMAEWGERNGCTINVFSPVESGVSFIEPLVLVPNRPDLPEKHVDLLYHDHHWFWIKSFAVAYTGRRANKKTCRHCLRAAHPSTIVCGADASVRGLAPASQGAVYKAKPAHYAARLRMPFVGLLCLAPVSCHDDEIIWELGGQVDSLFERRAAELEGQAPVGLATEVEHTHRRLTAKHTGFFTDDLLEALRSVAELSRSDSILQRYADNQRDRVAVPADVCCEACGVQLTPTTAVHHHEHLFGRFVAWLCQACNKAEAMHHITIVTSGLKSVVRRLRMADDGLGQLRWHSVGDWKDPYAMQLSWQCGGERRRMAVKLICIEHFLDEHTRNVEELDNTVRLLRDNVHLYTGIDPVRLSTTAQAVEAAFLTRLPTPIQVPCDADTLELTRHVAGGLVYARRGAYVRNYRTSIVEFDITKCFGSLLSERTAIAIGPDEAFPEGEDYRTSTFSDCWIAAEVDENDSRALQGIGIPDRVKDCLPVPQCVLLSLELCGATVRPLSFRRLTYAPVHAPLMGQLFAMHDGLKDVWPAGGALAKAMMVSSYGKLAQDDTSWPVQTEVRSPRDYTATQRTIVPSFRIELVKEAHPEEFLTDTWEIVVTDKLPLPGGSTSLQRKSATRTRVEHVRRLLTTQPLQILRVFPKIGYLIVRGAHRSIMRALDGIDEDAYVVHLRQDWGLEIVSIAPATQRRARRPIYPGQDIAMRSWAKIYTLLGHVCQRFDDVTVVRVMVDCLAVCVRHDPGDDVSDILRDMEVLGDGVTPGSWKDEFAGKTVLTWYQLNKCGYEVHYTDNGDGAAGRKRRLGGMNVEDRDALPRHFYELAVEDNETVVAETSRGRRTYAAPKDS